MLLFSFWLFNCVHIYRSVYLCFYSVVYCICVCIVGLYCMFNTLFSPLCCYGVVLAFVAVCCLQSLCLVMVGRCNLFVILADRASVWNAKWRSMSKRGLINQMTRCAIPTCRTQKVFHWRQKCCKYPLNSYREEQERKANPKEAQKTKFSWFFKVLRTTLNVEEEEWNKINLWMKEQSYNICSFWNKSFAGFLFSQDKLVNLVN